MFAAGLFAGASLVAHYASALCAAPRPRAPGLPPGPVSLIIPLCGVEPFSYETLRAALRLDGQYEILFCVADATDDVVPLVREAMWRTPNTPARLLIGDVAGYVNPKLRNMARGYAEARHPWVAFVDSNVLMPRDYLTRLFGAWTSGTGAVTAPAVGSRPRGFGASLECAFLNTYQARWQFAASAAGLGFAQGKCLFVRRDLFEGGGGINAFASEPAEDAALTKLVRDLNLKVRVAARASDQPLGPRDVRAVWARQVRWARLRRSTFAWAFAPEIATSGLLTAALAAFGVGPWYGLGAAALWYAIEIALAVEAGWPVTLLTLPALIARDAMLPVLWISGWLGNGFEWRGNALSVS